MVSKLRYKKTTQHLDKVLGEIKEAKSGQKPVKYFINKDKDEGSL